jgi:hypothetical protein
MSQDGRVAIGGLSRRNLLKAGAASLATVLGGPQAGIGTAVGAAPVGSERDLVLVNGKIHTMDARDRIAASITIRGGRIIALEYGGHGNQGSHGDQRVIDLKGRTVVPGIIDNHNHIRWISSESARRVLVVLMAAGRAPAAEPSDQTPREEGVGRRCRRSCHARGCRGAGPAEGGYRSVAPRGPAGPARARAWRHSPELTSLCCARARSGSRIAWIGRPTDVSTKWGKTWRVR